MLEPLPLHPLLEVILLYAREFHLQTCVPRCLLPTTFCRRGAAQHAMLAGLLLGIRAYAVHRHRALTTYRTACALPGKGRVGSEKVGWKTGEPSPRFCAVLLQFTICSDRQQTASSSKARGQPQEPLPAFLLLF